MSSPILDEKPFFGRGSVDKWWQIKAVCDWKYRHNDEYAFQRMLWGCGMMTQKVEKAISAAFVKNGMDPADFSKTNYLVHMDEADARTLYAEMQSIAATAGHTWYTFKEFVKWTAIRVDPAMPRGKIAVVMMILGGCLASGGRGRTP